MQVLRHDSGDTHTYTIDGKPVPGVTQVLKAAGFVDTRWFTPECRERGKIVHLMCALWDKGVPMLGLERPEFAEYLGYLEAWKLFRREVEYAPGSTELIVGNKLWGYGGTLDGLGLVRGFTGLCLADRKTGPPCPADGLQTAAYEACLTECHRRFGVHLQKNGKYKLVEHTKIDDWDAFVAALSCWKVKEKYGLNRED